MQNTSKDGVLRNRSAILCCCWTVVLSLSGCGGSGSSDPVEPDTARTTLISALDAWKDGKTPDSMQLASPKVVVQDMDWTGGAKLTSYQLLSDGEAIGANLSVQVTLELTGADGKTDKKDVWYLVGTDPVLTVFRDMLHP